MRHARAILIPMLAAVILAVAMAAPALASERTPVRIEVLTELSGFEDPFAADSPILCDTGTVSNGFVVFTGFQSNRHAQILILKQFECGDGTFDILLRVTLDFATGSTSGTWSVRGGTGAYEKLHGTGTLVGIPQGDESILDIYTGTLHTD